MSKPIISIQFPNPTANKLMHRALNCIEDVYRETHDKNLATVEDIDHYRNGCFLIKVRKKRRIGEVKSIINQRLRQHNLIELAVLGRCDEE